MARGIFFVFLACALPVPARAAAEPPVRLNTVGFLPEAQKRASVAAPSSDFSVLRASDGTAIFTGKTGPVAVNADTGEQISTADFSAVKEAGSYYLDITGVGKSPPFRIGADVYDAPYRTAMKGMYLWRCGTAVSAKHDGHTFSHAACHLNDAFLDHAGGGHVRKDAAGGWHDAGDYNKYVVNAGFSVGVMLQAWEHFSARIQDVPLDIPESRNATPDCLDEVRWELEWLLKMQADDGRVYHKVSTLKFGGFVPPEKETDDRFFAGWGSAATADFVAVMAMAARNYEPYDKDFARRCLAAGRKSYDFLKANPQEHRPDQKAFSTGPYDARDASRRLWAAVEMWQTTGKEAYLKDFEAGAKALERKVDASSGWANVKNLGMYTYALSKRDGRDPALREEVRKALVTTADEIVETGDDHGYGRPLGGRYFWGANGDVAQQAQTLHVANLIAPKQAYTDTALDALGYLLGRNPYGRSFVTGVGHNPPLHPHDRRSGSDEIADPWPGYLVGGGHPRATDWVDEQESYRTNEIAINWNATLIYALAGFVRQR